MLLFVKYEFWIILDGAWQEEPGFNKLRQQSKSERKHPYLNQILLVFPLQSNE